MEGETNTELATLPLTLSAPIDMLEGEISGIGEGSTTDAVCDLIVRVETLVNRAKQAKSMLDEVLIAFIQEHGPIFIGTVKYFVGNKKTTKCMDVPATLKSLLITANGDFDRLADALGSGAIKYGYARKTLPPAEYEKLFATVEEPKLEKNGDILPQLHKFDSQYVKSRTVENPAAGSAAEATRHEIAERFDGLS